MFIANGGYVVQTFYGISGWLVAFHFFEFCEGKKNVSFGYLIFAFINRYVRLTPVLLLVWAVTSTWMVQVSRGPYWDRIVGTEHRNCRNNGWTNLLYVNNYVDNEHMVNIRLYFLIIQSTNYLVLKMECVQTIHDTQNINL